MLSVRHWKDRRVPWHALVFWLWLWGFVFSFAASDLFHAPNCPEQTLLKWAGHPAKSALQSPAPSVLGAEIECAACAFQLAATAILMVVAPGFCALIAQLCFAVSPRWRGATGSLSPIARGPPLY